MQSIFAATFFTLIIVTSVYIRYVINIWNKNLCGTCVSYHIKIQYKLVYI